MASNINIMASSRYNNNGRNGNGNSNGSNDKSESKFCAVCHAAGRPGYDTHFVRADKFDRSSAITCPYLLSIECRKCGGTGHTASYCTTASRASSTAVAAPHPTSLACVRLPPISSSSHYSSSKHQPPRIVFPALEKEQKEIEYPQLPTNPNNRKTQSTTTLPPLPLPLSFSRFRNNEPLLKRGPPDAASAAEASPVHSPAATAAAPSNKIVYNKRGNAFADLASSDDEDEQELSHHSPAASPAAVGRYRPTKPLSWPSAPSPLLPPLEFKPRKTATASASAVPKKDKKKLWGDSDSEDDEEFLKRGLE